MNLVPDFDEELLQELGINRLHSKTILRYADQYQSLVKEFSEFLVKNG